MGIGQKYKLRKTKGLGRPCGQFVLAQNQGYAIRFQNIVFFWNLLVIAKPLSLLLISASVAGCASGLGNTAPVAPDPAMLAIARSADQIQRSWNRLGAIEAAKAPAYARYADDYMTLPYGLQKRVAINWNGPIEPLLRQIARDSGYGFRIIGHRPAVPVFVSMVTSEPIPLGFLLRDAGYQCGDRAGITLSGNVIELSYPSI